MRIGVFGGSFDPVHWGHLILAEQCREQARLDEVWFLPSAHHPFKADSTVTPFDQRVAMLRLAIRDVPKFSVCEIERDLAPPTYTANTLDALAERHPDSRWSFLLGSDALEELPTWHEPARIVERADFVVMARPGTAIPSVDELQGRMSLRRSARLRIQVIDVPLIDLSSRDIRQRVSEGRSFRFMTPRAVEDFIRSHQLYS
jgi:nicotinate-nucleotide adenylyltransferase